MVGVGLRWRGLAGILSGKGFSPGQIVITKWVGGRWQRVTLELALNRFVRVMVNCLDRLSPSIV